MSVWLQSVLASTFLQVRLATLGQSVEHTMSAGHATHRDSWSNPQKAHKAWDTRPKARKGAAHRHSTACCASGAACSHAPAVVRPRLCAKRQQASDTVRPTRQQHTCTNATNVRGNTHHISTTVMKACPVKHPANPVAIANAVIKGMQ
jgi:hypothetical protein